MRRAAGDRSGGSRYRYWGRSGGGWGGGWGGGHGSQQFERIRPQHFARRLRLPRVVVVMIREVGDAARELARGLRGDRLHLPLDRRHVLGRVALLPLHRRRDRHARGGDRRAACALPRRRRAHRHAQPLRRARDSRGLARSRRALVAGEGLVALRPLRLRLGRHGRAEAARIQRRHADRAARGVRRAVALAGAGDPSRAIPTPTSSTRCTRS